MITESEARELLQNMITYQFSAAEMARKAQVSRSHVSQVLKGTSPPGRALLALIGYRKKVMYEKETDNGA